ncbi:BTB/POZ domain-containing protein [Megavirus baoshan]|uniref:BTB/POZ domain-containing protein n=1 Tax=Megavirus baoshan TaxID=2496520 RepID=A0A3S8UY04_9VIRU|nr:BTB/POZ domain-containing protein [Megavirus baoshan]AZL89671.1 BTB/POZ domain-containing protein [Megavirus baoshan]
MDSLSLSTIFNSDILSDCTLDLVDENSMTTLNVHKIILYLGCPYFRSMFGEFKESNQSKITLEVPNVQATCDIIQSFYGTKIINGNNWAYELNMFMCKRFFYIDTNFPYQIKIPSDEFEEFLIMVDKIGFNQDIKKFIIKNIPVSYDFDKLLDLINKLELVCDYNKCIKLIAKYIPKSYDFEKLLIVINKLECNHNERVKLVAKYIPKTYDFNKLSTGLVRDLWKIVDTYYIVLISLLEINIINPEGTIYRNIKSPYEIQDVCYSEDKHLIAYHNKNNIYVYDIELDACIFRKKKYCDYEFKIKIYGDKLMIYKNYELNFYDINSGNLINSLAFRKEVINIFIDDKENKLTILNNSANDKIIYIFNLNTLVLLEKNIWSSVYSYGCNYSIINESMIALCGNNIVTKNLILLNFRKKGSCSMNEFHGARQIIFNDSSEIIGICWGKYGSIIYCCENGTINIYDTYKNKLKKTINIGKNIDTITKISNDIIMIKCGSELIEIDLDNGYELRNIDIDTDVKSIIKISSGYDRLFELLPKP